jgi:hypothetical protein
MNDTTLDRALAFAPDVATDRSFDRAVAFERGERDAEPFGHRDHVELAWSFLLALPFDEAAPRCARALQRFAAARGAPALYHVTITWAFLALVAERLEAPGARALPFERFASENPELFDKHLVARRYGTRLDEPAARRTFLLP